MTGVDNNNDLLIDFIQHPIWALALKRFIDIGISLLALCILSPVFIAVAACIKIFCPGPVFYRGLRHGYEGKPFRILKFRTMVKNSESLGGPTTGSNDPRVTRLGWLLRRTKLDELPQFANVFWGEMSLVGPRPEVLEYTNQYKEEERLILKMRPGITDYSSIAFVDLDDLVGKDDPDVYFRENILPIKNSLRLKYVKEWSIASDFRILYFTFLKVVQKLAKK